MSGTQRFDELSKALAQGASRRRLLRLLTGGLLGLGAGTATVLAGAGDAAAVTGTNCRCLCVAGYRHYICCRSWDKFKGCFSAGLCQPPTCS
jgi:hypothetical protein